MYKITLDGEYLYHPWMHDRCICDGKLTQEINKNGSCDITIALDHPLSQSVLRRKSILEVVRFSMNGNSETEYRGVVMNTVEDSKLEMELQTEGDMVFLQDSIIRPFHETGDDVPGKTTDADYFRWLIKKHNEQVDSFKQFTVGQVTITGTAAYRKRDSYSTARDILDELITESGGYIRTRTVGGIHYIDYLADYDTGDQEIRQGENMVDITKNVKTDDMASRLIPLGSATSNNEWPVTISSVNGGKDYLEDAQAVKEYGVITKTVEFSDIQDPAKLKTEAEKAFKKINGASLVTEVSAVDLADAGYDVQMLRIGENVQCVAPAYHIQKQMQITKKVTDLLKPANSNVTLGNTALTYTQRQLQYNQKTTKYVAKTLKNERNVAALAETTDKITKNIANKRNGKQWQAGKACLWYHTLEDYGNTDEEAAANLASNDVVVAGGALYGGDYTEATAARQIAIIKKAREINPNFKIFFYISIASWRNDGGWSHILGKGGYWDEEEAAKHQNAVRIHTKWEIFQLLEYAAHAGGKKNGKKQFIETYTWTDDNGAEQTEDKYIDLYDGGIAFDGCFYDDAGMESTEGRINQGFSSDLRQKYIDLVDFTHSKGLSAFPNQLSEDWYSDDVSDANPNGLPSSIGENDYMLLESCHSQIGFNGKPLWRHVNGTEGVWNYYQNWYEKIGAKVVVNDYLYGTGGDMGLSDEEFYELATYLLCDSLCCRAHYIDLNGLLTWGLPEFFDDLLIPEDETYDITRKAKGHYVLHANGHTLEVIRGDNLSQGETVSLKTLNKIYIYYDGIRIKNAFKKIQQYSYETDQRLDNVEEAVKTIQTSYKSTANIYHRMMIDDWNKKLILTNYAAAGNFIKTLEETAKNGIATVDSVDYGTNSIRLTRLNNTQINVYVRVDITEIKGHRLEFGFTVKEVTDRYSWGFDTQGPAVINWTNIQTELNDTRKSSYYGDDFYGYVRTVTIPEDTEEETWSIRLCFNGDAGNVFELANFYVVDVDEYGEDITKEWYTNVMPEIGTATNNNSLEICYTLEKTDDYGFDITWDRPEKFVDWSGLKWNFPDGTFTPGHAYEFGFTEYDDNSGGTGIAFRMYTANGEQWIPKTNKIKSSVYNDERPGYVFTIAESATETNGSLTFTNTSGQCQTSTGEYYKSSIRGMYIYDLDEQNIVFRGQDPSNSFLQICRVTDEKLANDRNLIGNAMYITNSGDIFVTDFNGNKTDMPGRIYAGAVNAGYNGTPDEFGAALYALISQENKTEQ